MEFSICILDYQESCKEKSASPRKQGVQRSLQGRMEEAEDMFHMLRLKYPFICQRLFLTQQTARTHQGWLCSTHIHTHTCGLALLFAQMWNSCMGRHRASSNTMPQSLSQYHLHSFYIPLWITAEMGMSAQLPSSLLLSELTQIPISSNLNRKLSNNHFPTETSPHPEESNSN